MKDVFISYSRKDTAVADRICAALDRAGISYFIDRQGIGGGMEFPEVLANAIIDCRVFLLLASKNSYASRFTNNEIVFAFNRKPKNSLLPYLIDDTELPVALDFTFAGINRRNIKEHPIDTVLVDDILNILGRKRTESHAADTRRETKADATVASVKANTLYVVFAHSGKKIKFPLDSIAERKGPDIVKILGRLNLDEYISADTIYRPGMDFIEQHSDILRTADCIYLIANEISGAAYGKLHALAQRKLKGKNVRYEYAASLCAWGTVYSTTDNTRRTYQYGHDLVTAEIGDGITEIISTVRQPGYIPIPQKDLLKGLVLRHGVTSGIISDGYVLLDVLGFDLYLKLTSNDKPILLLEKSSIIPCKFSTDIGCVSSFMTYGQLMADDTPLTDSICLPGHGQIGVTANANRTIESRFNDAHGSINPS